MTLSATIDLPINLVQVPAWEYKGIRYFDKDEAIEFAKKDLLPKVEKENPYTFPNSKEKPSVNQYNKVRKFMDKVLFHWSNYYSKRIDKKYFKSLVLMIDDCISKNKDKNQYEMADELVDFIFPLWMKENNYFDFEFMIFDCNECCYDLEWAIKQDHILNNGYMLKEKEHNYDIVMLPRHRSIGWDRLESLKQGGQKVISSIVRDAKKISPEKLHIAAYNACDCQVTTVDSYIKSARNLGSVKYDQNESVFIVS